jgi:hypothetical protein
MRIVERDEARAPLTNRTQSQRFQRQESHSLLLHERATDGVFPFIEYQPKVYLCVNGTFDTPFMSVHV